MGKLLAYDHWDPHLHGPLEKLPPTLLDEVLAPDYEALFIWGKLRLMKGIVQREIPQALNETLHLAHLLGSTEEQEALLWSFQLEKSARYVFDFWKKFVQRGAQEEGAELMEERGDQEDEGEEKRGRKLEKESLERALRVGSALVRLVSSGAFLDKFWQLDLPPQVSCALAKKAVKEAVFYQVAFAEGDPRFPFIRNWQNNWKKLKTEKGCRFSFLRKWGANPFDLSTQQRAELQQELVDMLVKEPGEKAQELDLIELSENFFHQHVLPRDRRWLGLESLVRRLDLSLPVYDELQKVALKKFRSDQCHQREAEKCYQLGQEELFKGMDQVGTLYLQRSCYFDYGPGCAALAERNRELGMRKLARDYAHRACQLQNGLGCLVFLSLGSLEQRKNPKETLMKSCELGEGLACALLGAIQEKDLGEQSEVALRHYERSCERKFPLGCLLAGASSERRGEKEQARAYYKKSCDLGNASGCKRMALP